MEEDKEEVDEEGNEKGKRRRRRGRRKKKKNKARKMNVAKNVVKKTRTNYFMIKTWDKLLRKRDVWRRDEYVLDNMT